MDPAECELPQLVCPEKKPRLDGEKPTQAVSVTKVLDDDNLLREIIVRIGLPNTLVRAALVCKRWLEHASDRKLLCRFRELHPPQLLGYYITEDFFCSRVTRTIRFVPMLPHPPELAAIIRRLTRYNFRTHKIMNCRNGTVLTRHHEGEKWTYIVHRPLCAETDMQILPPLPCVEDHNIEVYNSILSKEEASGLFYFSVRRQSTGEPGKITMRVYIFEDGVWRTHTSAPCFHRLQAFPQYLFVAKKIYMLANCDNEIVVLDLTTLGFSTIKFPEGVKYQCYKSRLSHADDVSSVYLIHVMESRLCIWIHKGDTWLLIDAICLNEMIANFWMPSQALVDKDIANCRICQVGDYGQFVLLQLGKSIFHVDIKGKMLCRVCEYTFNSRCCTCIHPFMMMWPPTFPALTSDSARKLLDGL